ncbi:MAG: MFS transporter, partial [Nocardioidaceae bacterium]
MAGRFFTPAETAAIKQVVAPRQLPTAFSQNEARQHLASLVGPPVAGALYAVTRWVPFLADAVSFGLSTLAISRIQTRLPAPERLEKSTSGMRQEIAEGLRFLWSSAVLRAIVLFACVINFASSALFLVLTLKLLRAGIHPATIGVVDTIGAVAGILGAVAAPLLIKRVPTGPLSTTAV